MGRFQITDGTAPSWVEARVKKFDLSGCQGFPIKKNIPRLCCIMAEIEIIPLFIDPYKIDVPFIPVFEFLKASAILLCKNIIVKIGFRKGILCHEPILHDGILK